MAPSTPLTNLQQELLKLFPQHLSEDDLLNVKALLGQYFAKRQNAEPVTPPLPISPDILALQGSVQLSDDLDWKQARADYLNDKYLK
jgi:hypothetical protein